MSENNNERSFTPREIVGELDRYIIGQQAAKRSVAIALRNRWRRKRVPPPLRDEIAPKNIILMGPTGCGKTEIARRLAKLAQAPFVKVEATKFTEVGYVGRDVDSMVRDLIETAVKLVKEEATAEVETRARDLAEERVLDVLLPRPAQKKTFAFDVPAGQDHAEPSAPSTAAGPDKTRERLRDMLREGKLDDREVEIEVSGSGSGPLMQMFAQPGMEDMAQGLQDALSNAFGGRRKQRRKMRVPEALDALATEEADKLVDMEQVQRDAIERAEQSGIIFIDELDKVAVASGHGRGPDVSREGVQRDILPIVEGSTVNTKYGSVKTDHVLFIAAGAFHMSKPSDLIPELQGRFPIRVELESLTEADFIKILTEPENSLVKQYEALLATEGVEVKFTGEGLAAIAQVAAEANRAQENIGARRLHTVMERLLDEISFEAPDRKGTSLTVDEGFVRDKLAPILEAEDLSKYIL